jgi:hypothetical protein
MDLPPVLPTSAAATKAVSAVVEEAKSLVGKFLGPACEEFGALIGEGVRFLRLKNQVRLLKKATQILETEGLEPKAVNLKIFVPLLEAGALEEDIDMAERWAALLASAANPKNKYALEPSFIDILRQLSPIQARIVEVVYQQLDLNKIPEDDWNQRGILAIGLQQVLNIERAQFQLAVDNLARLRLIGFPSIGLQFINDKDARFQLSNSHLLCGTQIGKAFVLACRKRGVTTV